MYKKFLFSLLLVGGLSAFSQEENSSFNENNTSCEYMEETPIILQNTSPQQTIQKSPIGFFMKADFLYFQTKEDGFDFATKNTKQLQPSKSLLDLDSEIISFDFDFNPGFKVGVGYRVSPKTGWDVFLNWMELNSRCSTKEAISTSNTIGLAPLFWKTGAFSANENVVRFQQCNAKFKLDFNSVDFEIGNTFYVSKLLSLRPHAGFKGAVINQDFQVYSYNGNTVLNSDWNELNILNGTSKFKSSAKGVGPRIGINSNWNVKNKEVDIFANYSFAFLLTRFNTSYFEYDTAYNVTTQKNISNLYKVNEYIWLVKPTMQITTGLNWNKYFNEKHLTLSLGYEIQYFWKQNLSRKLIDDQSEGVTYPNKGNLYLQGLILAAQFEF